MAERDAPGGTERVGDTVITAIVGIDGCGKTSTFRDAVSVLAQSVRTAGVGDVVLDGRPSQPPAKPS